MIMSGIIGKALHHELRMGFKPKCARGAGGIEPKFLPPGAFVTVTVNFAMVSAAQRDSEFVTDLAAERRLLRKAQMMGVTGLSSADQAGLL
jgi:hypothetical protein